MTETQTVDLASWLDAIWKTEERLAKEAMRGAWEAELLPERWEGDRPAYWVKVESADEDGGVTTGTVAECPWGMADARFIAYHDPALVLARIAADRKILELHGVAWNGEVCTVCHHLVGRDLQVDNDAWPCMTVRLLASPYKGREGWQEAWADE